MVARTARTTKLDPIVELQTGYTQSVGFDPNFIAAINKGIQRGLAAHGTEPRAVLLGLPGVRDMDFLFMLDHYALNLLVTRPDIFSKGRVGRVLTSLQGGHDGLTSAELSSPVRDYKKLIMDEIDRLYDEAVAKGLFEAMLHLLFTELKLGTKKVGVITHKHLADFINEAFFNKSYKNFGKVLVALQNELGKMIPEDIRRHSGFNPLAWLIGTAGSAGINKYADVIRTETMNVIKEMRKNPDGDYGLFNSLKHLPDEAISGLIQGVLQGLLDTTGNIMASMLWVIATQPAIRKIAEVSKDYQSIWLMIASIWPAVPFILRGAAEEMVIGSKKIRKGTKVGASGYHAVRKLLGLSYGDDLNYVEILQQFRDGGAIIDLIRSILFGGAAQTHCIGQNPAEDMLSRTVRYVIENKIQFEVDGEARYTLPLTALLTNFYLKVV